jgi:hypothetical protein
MVPFVEVDSVEDLLDPVILAVQLFVDPIELA